MWFLSTEEQLWMNERFFLGWRGGKQESRNFFCKKKKLHTQLQAILLFDFGR